MQAFDKDQPYDNQKLKLINNKNHEPIFEAYIVYIKHKTYNTDMWTKI